MSLSTGAAWQAVMEGIAACNRLAPKLLDLVAEHDHAAAVARPDWSGPHHDTFEDRFMSVQQALLAGAAWVLQVRHELEHQLAALTLAAEEAATPVPATGPQ
jgi:hypothetical protein